jgi:hypothetical protein
LLFFSTIYQAPTIYLHPIPPGRGGGI